MMQETLHKRVEKLMGNRFEIGVVSQDETWANQQIENAIDEIKRIEKLLTTYAADSQTNQINQSAGIEPVVVDAEVFGLIARSIQLSRLTQGAFDITYGSIDKSLWNFDQQMKSLPSKEVAQEMVKLINFENIVLNEPQKSVFLREKGMRIGFGGIGKGYAADKAKVLLQQNGIKAGIINASGDLATWGHQPDGKPWTIGIANPNMKNTAFSRLNISNLAVATSGNYEKFVVIDGKKYSHTIDPKTGYPVQGIKSVSIIAPSAELADALATPVMVMGKEVGLDLINQLKGIACIIIDEQNKVFLSKNINAK
jgi:FAD:protein FMN transferase